MSSLFEIVDKKTSSHQDHNSLHAGSRKVIIMDKITLGYDKDKNLIEEADFVVRENDWIAIVGGNGTGKTTLLRSILGLEKPLSGTISVYDMKPGSCNPDIGYIPQVRECFLPPKMSAKTLLIHSFYAHRIGLPNTNPSVKERVEMLLNWVGMKEYESQPIVLLSGGQRQKVYLAQAMINDPKMLILDEPLVSLDLEAKMGFINLLRSLHKHSKITVLMVSHDLYNISEEFNCLVHLRDKKIHFCKDRDCIRRDNVNI